MIPFPLAIQSGTYGYKTTTGTFVAFRSDSTGTYTFPSGSTGSTVDLGAKNTYRYVNATNVYEKGKSDGGGFINDNSYLVTRTGQISNYTNGVGFIIGVSEFSIVNVRTQTNLHYTNSTGDTSSMSGIKNQTSYANINLTNNSNTDITNYDYIMVRPYSRGNSTFTFT